MTTIKKFVLRSIFVCACMTLIGCSWVSPQHTGTRLDTLRTWKDSKLRKEYSSRAIDVQAADDGRTVTVTVHRPRKCVVDTVVFKETQEVDEYQPPWVAVGSLLGGCALGAGLGGYFTATASGRPDLDDPYSRDELSKVGSLGIGLPLVAAGLAAGVTALWSIVTAQDEPHNPQVSEEVVDEERSDCGQEVEEGVKVVLITWEGRRLVGKTDYAGRAVCRLHPARFRLPPPEQAWATVEADGVQPKHLTPPASALVADVFASKDLEQFERFRQRFGDGPEWEGLEPRYRQLVAEKEAEQAEAEEARKAELEREQAAWEKEAKALFKKAKRLDRKRRWDDVLELLESAGGPPLEGRGEALMAQIEKLQSDATDALEAARSPGVDYQGISLGMTKAEVRRLRKLRCDPPKPGGQRCKVAPKGWRETWHKAVFIKGRLRLLDINFKASWEADYDEVVASYIERFGAPSKTMTDRIPFGPYIGQYLRITLWERSGYTFDVSCRAREPLGTCKAFGSMMMGDEEDMQKVNDVLIDYGE